jgi:hypothetical protein
MIFAVAELLCIRRDLVRRKSKKGRFLKKAAQKLFRLWAGGGETSTAQFKKVFCFFFSKKKPSFFL